jgi:hypothetical protein
MNEISDEEQINNDENDVAEITENLEDVLNSFNKDELSVDILREIADTVKNRIDAIKIRELPPIEHDIADIDLYIEKKRIELEKAKKSSVFVNDVSDDIEFHYSDHRARNVEEEIKEQLNKKYNQEKNKFKLLEELEELEGRNSVCSNLLMSYELRDNINELVNYSNEVVNELHFDISDYNSISTLNYDSIESWENNWNIIVEITGKANIYNLKLKSLFEFFNDIKKQLEEKDPETPFVHSELEQYPDLEPLLQEVTASHEDNLMSSIAALYELAVNYEVGYDYLPENKTLAVGRINRLKSIIMIIRSSMDNYKLDYKDFRKTINNIFVLLNKAFQSIENQQKILKNQQEARIKKIKELMGHISRSNVDVLRQGTNDLNNTINNLGNLGASSYEMEALQYYFSLKARYPVDESAREEIVNGLNGELDRLNLMEIDLMCKILDARYEPRKGFYTEGETAVRPSKPAYQPLPEPDGNTVRAPESTTQQPRGKTGNLDFLGNMYLKEAQRSKGQWAAKSYLKACDAFMKCAETEEDPNKKINFLKLALKTAKDALTEKEDSFTFSAYAFAYKELAYNHSGKNSPQSLVKIGDNFVAAAKQFIREENIESAKNCFREAHEAYLKAPPDETVNLRIESVKKYIR